MKLDVLVALCSADTVAQILHEFGRYVKDDDKDFVKACIQSIVTIANAHPEIADRCLRGLMALVSTNSDTVVAESVIAIRQLLQQHPQHDSIIVRLGRKLGSTASPSAPTLTAARRSPRSPRSTPATPPPPRSAPRTATWGTGGRCTTTGRTW